MTGLALFDRRYPSGKSVENRRIYFGQFFFFLWSLNGLIKRSSATNRAIPPDVYNSWGVNGPGECSDQEVDEQERTTEQGNRMVDQSDGSSDEDDKSKSPSMSGKRRIG